MKLKVLGYFLFLTALLLMITGCSSSTKEEATENDTTEQSAHDGHAHSSGDLRELTNSVDTLPQFLTDKPEQMQIIYAAAAKHQELLEYMPCYCGCGDSVGHRDNYDCFVFENKENGEIMWDDHGTRCGVCLETAAESILQYKDGKSIGEIREYIDNKYKEGFAEPTKTKIPDGI
ncbi:PCYCGC motif-containing (lipo)protein [Bacillus sp. 31A1R]|uniref:PCYCGC motif-containing (Lipo)protein n=1 Tax=Robertmurraya mangrovi TaxID=3098077 RepID=A0ABU5J154_9BACI|nr:PCYCGC motif-containing (lipo)protein [Bacillus sp. 31A1R]MDZ5473124.1 PCYCGC motif-containing (lipo)protein [Bacillus sp. 31A1R]